MIKQIKYFIKKDYINITILLFLETSLLIFVLINPVLYSLTVDKISSFTEFSSIAFLLVLLIVTHILQNLISALKNLKSQIIINDYSKDIVDLLLVKLNNVNILEFDKVDNTYLSSEIYHDSQIISNFVINNIPRIILNSVTFLVCVFYLFYVNVNFAILVFIAIIVNFMMYFMQKKSIFHSRMEYSKDSNIYFSALNDQIHNLEHIIINSLFKESKEYFDNKFNKLKKSLVRNIKIGNYYFIFESTLNQVLGMTLLLLSGYLVARDVISLGSFVLVSSYYNIAINMLRSFTYIGKDIQEAFVAKARLESINSLIFKEENKNLFYIEGLKEISIQNLTFEFLNDKKIINNFSYKFKKNKIYLISGSNGVGKTTFIQLLIGLIKPCSGSISFNGTNIECLNMELIRRNLISFSSYDFMKISKSYYSEVVIKKQANNIDKTKLKYNFTKMLNSINFTLNLNDISSLSLSELKKAELLLILNKNSEIVVLDEPTEGLDENSKKEFYEAIKKLKKNRIVIIVSHDINISKIATDFIDAKDFICA